MAAPPAGTPSTSRLVTATRFSPPMSSQPRRALRRAGAPLPAALGVLRTPPRGCAGGCRNRGILRRPNVAGSGGGLPADVRGTPGIRAPRRAPVVFDSIEDFVERSSALVGSPEQVIDKVGRYREQLGHEVMHLSADADGITANQQRRSLELFQSDVAPVLRARIPSRPLVAQSAAKEVVS